MIRVIVLLLPLFLLCSGCDLKKREEALKKKEATIVEREQQLSLREKSVAIKEEELLQLQKRLDSAQTNKGITPGKDSALVYNQQLVGNWNVKMTCTETTCAGSAVGDTKSETWAIGYENNHLIAKAMANDKLARVYTGNYDGTNLMLTEAVVIGPTEPVTKLSIRLTPTGDNTMEGQREIIRENDCRIVYSLQLSKEKPSTK